MYGFSRREKPWWSAWILRVNRKWIYIGSHLNCPIYSPQEITATGRLHFLLPRSKTRQFHASGFFPFLFLCPLLFFCACNRPLFYINVYLNLLQRKRLMEDQGLIEMLTVINFCRQKKRKWFLLLQLYSLISVVQANGCLWRNSIKR